MSEPTYFTVQMSDTAFGGRHCIHLGRDTERGGLGDNICGNSRHGRNPLTGDKYGFSANGGGSSDPDAFTCAGCALVLKDNPGDVRGIFADLFRHPEPTEIGSRVIDRDGEMWVRSARDGWWCLQSRPGHDVRKWHELRNQYGPLESAS